MTDKPKLGTSDGKKELDKAEANFDKFDQEVKAMTMDRMNQAPRVETEQQTQLSSREIQKNNSHYLKPKKTISSREKFNEEYRAAYEEAKEYVNFIAENKEIIGEHLDIWTKPYAGMPAEEWDVPVNKPVWGPRYLAEQIKRKYYHRLKMDQTTVVENNGVGQIYGAMAVDTTVQRLDAHPVSQRKSIFMGASGF